MEGRVVGVVTEARRTFGYAVPAPMLGFLLTSWRIELAPEEIAGRDGIRMVLLPAGVFKMGRQAQQVYLDAFYIDKTVSALGEKTARQHRTGTMPRDIAISATSDLPPRRNGRKRSAALTSRQAALLNGSLTGIRRTIQRCGRAVIPRDRLPAKRTASDWRSTTFKHSACLMMWRRK